MIFGCKGHRRAIEADAERQLDKYDEEMVDDLITMMKDRLEDVTTEDIDEDILEEVWLEWKENLPDPDEWAYETAKDRCIDAMEEQAEARREMQWEKDHE